MAKKLSIIILSLLLVAVGATAIALGLTSGKKDGGSAESGTTQDGSSSDGATTGGNATGGNTSNGSSSSEGNTNAGGNVSGGNNTSGGTDKPNGGNTSGGNSSGNDMTVNGSEKPHVCSFTFSETVAAECTAQGYDIYSCICGKTDNRNYTKALGHDYVYEVHDATCTTDWSMTTTCSRCDYSDFQTVADSKKHTFVNYVPNNDATCVKDETETAQCEKCTATDTRTVPNSKTDHIFGTYVSNNDATCSKQGTKTAKCINCTEKDTLPDETALVGDHVYGGWTEFSGDCLTAGYRIRTCSECNDEEKEWTNYGKHPVQKFGATCTKCGETVGYVGYVCRDSEEYGDFNIFYKIYGIENGYLLCDLHFVQFESKDPNSSFIVPLTPFSIFDVVLENKVNAFTPFDVELKNFVTGATDTVRFRINFELDTDKNELVIRTFHVIGGDSIEWSWVVDSLSLYDELFISLDYQFNWSFGH